MEIRLDTIKYKSQRCLVAVLHSRTVNIWHRPGLVGVWDREFLKIYH